MTLLSSPIWWFQKPALQLVAADGLRMKARCSHLELILTLEAKMGAVPMTNRSLLGEVCPLAT